MLPSGHSGSRLFQQDKIQAMKILIAPNSMKGAASPFEAADAIEAGFRKADSEFDFRKLPLADGGEYTLEVIMSARNGKIIETESKDPIGRSLQASYGIESVTGTAVIELSKASGFSLLKENERASLQTSTYGTGLLIRDAVNRGCKSFILTLGGSATVDGGAGILQALGISLVDSRGKELSKGGGQLASLDHFKPEGMPAQFRDIQFTILCDVENPLVGEFGAARIFGPQKGAGPGDVALLESCLDHFGSKCEAYSGKSLKAIRGSGAAGGVLVGLSAFFDTTMVPGTGFMLDLLRAEEQINWADVLITAEGRLDDQTFGGKAPAIMAGRMKEQQKKTICIAGEIPLRSDQPDGIFDAVFSLQNKPMSLRDSIRDTHVLLENTGFEIGRLLRAGDTH